MINDFPIKVAVINNGNLGMVRQWQTLFYGERYSNTKPAHRRRPPGARLREGSPRRTAAWACAASGPRTSTP
ncbi:hypothetical protein GCM10025868_39790 [Angustibacter aerolatus]|uniref:Thiamine pyrophosphate enzyme TPP-binding domain-containing protein n=1 Tax=Angustibacter aerolatus TaxID=1162965 RepID=A0ABQ6JNN5_9ACTN|nr:thiamine pyrophosphate-dependent enzyme [Angustibacter aerolatus]GMA88729.1 hypothetical protein GCM10025868_39790 [Angustibacter aerolatus]